MLTFIFTTTGTGMRARTFRKKIDTISAPRLGYIHLYFHYYYFVSFSTRVVLFNQTRKIFCDFTLVDIIYGSILTQRHDDNSRFAKNRDCCLIFACSLTCLPGEWSIFNFIYDHMVGLVWSGSDCRCVVHVDATTIAVAQAASRPFWEGREK